MAAQHITFESADGKQLSALLNRPAGTPKAYALFAHCFTCGKDIPSARIIAETLTGRGFAVLRFDFTGLGSSDGEFANTNFSSNIDDLVAAADFLRTTENAPTLLIGHSLGGAAVLAAASRIAEAKAVATIGAPCDPSHITNLFSGHVDEIAEKGAVNVSLAGRPFTIKKQFLDDISEQNLAPLIGNLRKALLVMHAPTDQTVGIENASFIFGHAKHPKSFISLDGADHLLKRRADATFAADMLAVWAMRHVGAESRDAASGEAVLVAETGAGRFQQSLALGPHHLFADEPRAMGGMDSGPSPYQLLLAALGSCTTMTVRMYADRKKIPLKGVSVALTHSRGHFEDVEAACEGAPVPNEVIDRTIQFTGELSPEEHTRLLEIADRCPVHRTLTASIPIRTVEAAITNGARA